jgi:hypothetical protein
VVLPTPGPPVMTTTRFLSTVFSASRWLGARVFPVWRSHHATDLQVVNPRNNGRKIDLLALITTEKQKR